MSGHSKWHSIKHKKALVDAKKGKIFTTLSKAITLAAREKGGDLSTNFKLRLAVEKAREMNMPKDNIDRAIKRGTGESGGEVMEEMVYEAFGPGGVPLVIETITDNRNRTVTNIKTVLGKKGGSLSGANSVLWMFERKGVVRVLESQLKRSGLGAEEAELVFIDLGADDLRLKKDDGAPYFEIIFPIDHLGAFQDFFNRKQIKIEDMELEYLPKEKIKVDSKIQDQIKAIVDALGKDEDVTRIYTNIDF